MSASDSHRAEVRKYISQYVTNPLPTGIREPSVTEAMRSHEEQKVDAIMALLDSERERWIGEVKAALPAKRTDSYIKHDYNTGKDIKTTKPKTVGFNEALDAVSRVLDTLQ